MSSRGAAGQNMENKTLIELARQLTNE